MILTVWSLAATGAFAADTTFTVTNSNDSGAGSLRQAVLDANAAPQSGSYEIAFSEGLTPITLSSQLFVNANVSVAGNGTTVSGNNLDRIFFVAGGTVEFHDLNLIDGRAKGGDGGEGGGTLTYNGGGGGGAGLGGAIFVANGAAISGSGVTLPTNVTLSNVTSSNNTAVGGNGGGGGELFTDGGGGGGMGGNGGLTTIASSGGGGFGNGANGATGNGIPAVSGAFLSAPTVVGVVTGGGGGSGVGGGVGIKQNEMGLYVDGGFGGGGATFGNGGFGGGGGAATIGKGTNGGFGGGGGGGSEVSPDKGLGGFGGGDMYVPLDPLEEGGGGGGLGAGGAIFVMQGAQLTIVDGGFDGNTVFGGAGGVPLAGRGSAIGASIFLGGTTTISTSANTALEIFESIGGGDDPDARGGIIKVGSGTLHLAGNNSYVGGTQIDEGTVLVNNGNAVGSGTLTVNASGTFTSSGNLRLDKAVKASGMGATISAAGYIEVGYEGAGSLELLQGGRMVSPTTTAFGVLAGANGTGNVSGAGSSLESNGALFLGYLGTGILTVGNGGTVTASRIIIGSEASGSGSLVVNSGGTVQVGGNDALLLGAGGGSFTLAGGTLKVVGFDLTSSMNANLNAVSTIDTNGFSAMLTGNLLGTGGITKTGAGTLTLFGNNNYLDTTTVSAGVLSVASEMNIGGNVNTAAVLVQSGGHLAVSSSLDLNRAVTVDGAGSRLTTGTFLHMGVSGSASLTVTNGGEVGAGSWFILGVTGPVTASVSGSNSQLNSGGLLTIGDQAAAVLTIEAGGRVNSPRVALGVGVAGHGTLNLNSGGQLNVGGANGITAGIGSYAFNLSGGTLKVANSNLTTSINMTLSNSSLVDTNGFEATLSGVLSGTGALSKTGAGTLFLTGNNTYGGPTTVSAGTLVVSGSLGPGLTTVATGAEIGGDGTLGGNLYFEADANLLFNPAQTLIVDGDLVAFGGFGVENLAGLDSSIDFGTYTLIDGAATFDFTNVENFGLINAYYLGGGKFAYFEEGSLDLVVSSVPEPTTALLLALGFALFARRASFHRGPKEEPAGNS